MNSVRRKYIFNIQIGAVILLLFGIVCFSPLSQNIKIGPNTTFLDKLDSFDIEVQVKNRYRAVLVFNGEYVTDVITLNYNILNGESFDWDKLHPPFRLKRNYGSDTVELKKNLNKYYFLVDQGE